MGFKRKSLKSPKTIFYPLFLYISNSSYTFHILWEITSLFPDLCLFIAILLGGNLLFHLNHASAYRVVRCSMFFPPTETKRKGMLQKTQQRFPAPCKPLLKKKKAPENSLYERSWQCKRRFHCTAFSIKLYGYPL